MNEIVESPFGASRTTALAEHAGQGQVQAREVAELQTQYLMAQKFPRDERVAMDRIIGSFQRPTLAERAQYEYARGGTSITGPSIHAAQAIATQWGNIEFGWREVSRGVASDGVPFSEVQAFAVDLQSRVPSRIQFVVRHWRDTRQGGYKLKDERDIYELCANMAQRRKRACILSILPQDVVDSAMEQASLTLNSTADVSPEALKKMVEKFAAFGVTKVQIEKRIQRSLESISPAQVVGLRRIYASLSDDMSKPAEWFEGVESAEPREAAAAAVTAAVKAATPAKPKATPAATPTSKPSPTPEPAGATQTPPDELFPSAAQENAPAADSGRSAPVPSAWDLGRYAQAIQKSTDRDAAAVYLDEARTSLSTADYDALVETYRGKFPE